MNAPPHNLRPRYNVCPTDPVDVVTAHDGKRELIPMRWGLVLWWWRKSLKELRMSTFNARAETVETKPVFPRRFQALTLPDPDFRLLRMAEHPERKAVRWLTAPNRSRALGDEWKNRETGERLKSCTMIITEPNGFAAEIHDRMPVFLREGQFEPWLSGEAGAGILKPAPNDYLQRWPVSRRVNSSKADAEDATLIEPVELVG
jgi:putative SOS response-associated peptidase YedK